MICASLILGAHLASYHLEPKERQSNANAGAYVECDGWAAGAYRNTMSRTSVYAGYTLRHGPFALSIGAVSGYQTKWELGTCRPGYTDNWTIPCRRGFGFSSAKLMPMLTPSVTLGPARIWYLPRSGQWSDVLHLSLQKEWR